jgi:hypothetical protein
MSELLQEVGETHHRVFGIVEELMMTGRAGMRGG